MGYSLDEIRGRHHSMFADPDFARSDEYKQFWLNLGRGEFFAGKFQRQGKGGVEIWIQGAYNPVFDAGGKPCKVIKFCTDITQAEHERLANEALRKTEAEQGAVVLTLADNLRRLAGGDLTADITAAFDGRFASIKSDYNAALQSLRQAMTEIGGSTQGVHNGSNEITTASEDLSKRTEQQAAALEETAAALDEITATVRRSAEGARAASTAASSTRQEVTRSGEIMRDAIAAMGEIEQSSGKIGQIIGVIDEIAFQTNLLALNAGVEAARAGDAGRGFAVVAQEVRALAQRSADAAKEIKGLIRASTDEVGKGVRLVGETGETLQQIMEQVSEINALVGEIASSAKEQSVGLAEVNTAVNQMDQVTQQNAAMVEQSTAAAHALSNEAGELERLIGRFQVGAEVRELHPRQAPRAPAAPRREAFRERYVQSGAALKIAPQSRPGDWEEF